MNPSEFYRKRKYESRKRLLEDYFLRKFREFIRWRTERGDILH